MPQREPEAVPRVGPLDDDGARRGAERARRRVRGRRRRQRQRLSVSDRLRLLEKEKSMYLVQ